MSRTKIMACINQKGGTGKSTTCENLGIGLANEGKKVLLVDMDPQASLTIALGWQRPDDLETTISDLMIHTVREDPLPYGAGILHHGEGVDLIPANISLAGLEVSLVNVMSRESVLKETLSGIRDSYDYILLDGMPSLGMLTINTLAASDSIVIPVQPQYLSAKGLEQLLQTVHRVKRQINPGLKIDGILLSKTEKPEIPIRTAADLCSINRTSIYYAGRPISDTELECKGIIDRLHTDNPTWGARQMSAQLKQRGYRIGRKKARHWMTEMAIDPIYPKPNLSKCLQRATVVPYLLRNAEIVRPNQAWSIDITYIKLKHGFLYLTAIIDWYSRCIVGWELDDTLDTRACIVACEKAFRVAKPEILNSDQGCQFTSQEYKNFLKGNNIRQSMDGKSRWADNIKIERWFRSFKYEEAYLTEWNNIKEARAAISRYIYNYNFERCHSAIGNVPPATVYYPVLLYEAAREAA